MIPGWFHILSANPASTMSELVKTGKARSEQMFSGLPPKRTSDLRASAARGLALTGTRASKRATHWRAQPPKIISGGSRCSA